MTIPRWEPDEALTKQETLLLRQVQRTRKLFGFLRLHRHELFSAEFQDELATMYRGCGKTPRAPGLLAMATLLQAYLGVSDAEAVQLTVVDLRWQMVLGCLGTSEPPFSQGTLHDFRARLIRTNMDRRLLERTVEVARESEAFDWKKLPKSLDVAMDSSPLGGGGRVEDTFNLLGRAARSVVLSAAKTLRRKPHWVAKKAGIPLALASSIKAGLDIDWADDTAKADALNALCQQVEALQRWTETTFEGKASRSRVSEPLATLEAIQRQDLETNAGGARQVRKGVAKDRQISISDPEMRHGRKTKNKCINGFKRHVATDVRRQLIVACAVTPANIPEARGGEFMKADIDELGIQIEELHIDRGYLASTVVEDVLARSGAVLCKPWPANNGSLFSKADFSINLDNDTITCPAGVSRTIERGATVAFPPERCDPCALRAKCTKAAQGRGRTVRIADDEDLQLTLRRRQATSDGRARLRERVTVEHSLARIGARQGPRARYRGVRRNLFDLRRVATIQNLETLHRRERQLAA